MTKDQAEVLNIVQEVLRGVVIATGALNPDRIAEMSATLAAFAGQQDMDPRSQAMLQDLAQGPAMLAKGRSKEH
ncbi:MAG: hypothetical protein E6Q94_01705 [Burkholderiaceae bacterium]|nr:MAG: hypothetical protein E6Q94_01705 [Burkholderiaceae bacterium]